ncbi:hypothetical protein D3C87_1285540 [compost metagenome]
MFIIFISAVPVSAASYSTSISLLAGLGYIFSFLFEVASGFICEGAFRSFGGEISPKASGLVLFTSFNVLEKPCSRLKDTVSVFVCVLIPTLDGFSSTSQFPLSTRFTGLG